MGKIAYLTGAWPVWSETFIQQELQLLLAEGLPILPMAVTGGNASVPSGFPDVHILRPTKLHGTGGAQLGRGWIPGLLRRQISMLKNSPMLAAMFRYVRENDVTHVHAAFSGLPALLASAASRKLGISYSVSVHAQGVFCRHYDDKYLYKRAAFVCVCNQAARNELLRRSPWLADRLHLVHHGLCLKDWPMREQQSIADPIRFLYVGRLVDKKDPLAAVRLVRDLNREGIPARLTMVGEGPLGAVASKEAADFEAHFPGVLLREDVKDMLCTNDFLLSTSCRTRSGDQEGIPNVILEAMATGVPVLASASGGVEEVITRVL